MLYTTEMKTVTNLIGHKEESVFFFFLNKLQVLYNFPLRVFLSNEYKLNYCFSYFLICLTELC